MLDVQLVQLVIDEIYRGRSFTQVSKAFGVDRAEFFRLLNANSELKQEYAYACEARSEVYIDEAPEIADGELDPARARVRIEARKLYAATMHPKKFGNKVDVNVNHSLDVAGILAEARQRVGLPGRDTPKSVKGQVIDTAKQLTQGATGCESVAGLGEGDIESGLADLLS